MTQISPKNTSLCSRRIAEGTWGQPGLPERGSLAGGWGGRWEARPAAGVGPLPSVPPGLACVGAEPPGLCLACPSELTHADPASETPCLSSPSSQTCPRGSGPESHFLPSAHPAGTSGRHAPQLCLSSDLMGRVLGPSAHGPQDWAVSRSVPSASACASGS